MKLKELLRQAYRWGVDNGSGRSEKNFNDFLQTSAVEEALNKTFIVKDIEYDTDDEEVGISKPITATISEDVNGEDIK
jgi:hypothetical protein